MKKSNREGMNRCLCFLALCFLPFFVSAQNSRQKDASAFSTGKMLNITPYGTICSWKSEKQPLGETVTCAGFNRGEYGEGSNIGVFWWDARDVQQLEVVYRSELDDKSLEKIKVQYWHDTWPEEQPHMPSMEDLEDDPWRGEWVTAQVDATRKGGKIVYTFKSLSEKEVPHAQCLPGPVNYRRTLKIRLVNARVQGNDLEQVKVFSSTVLEKKTIRIEFLSNAQKNKRYSGSVTACNGVLKSISDWNFRKGDNLDKTRFAWGAVLDGNKKGILLETLSSGQMLPGSNDETVVSVKSSEGNFSFSMSDLKKGPIYIPDFKVYITSADDPTGYSETAFKQSGKIRERIETEPEQSYERARKEIPHLDPLQDQGNNRIFLPLACDASWQKFAVEWGGNIIIDKDRVKATGKALARCNWNGNGLKWDFGVGDSARYLRNEADCRMSVLNNYLPVVNATWRHEGLVYAEEAFATFVNHCPLSPEDKDRNEQVPSVLMVKIHITNPSLKTMETSLWLRGNSALNDITVKDGFIFDHTDSGQFLRGYLTTSDKNQSSYDLSRDTENGYSVIRQKISLDPGMSKTVYFYVPFVGDLTEKDQSDIANLHYDTEKDRVVDYWRGIVAKNTKFQVPEQPFNELSKAVIPHIRMSTTKDPQSGSYMVPAAAFSYLVYANESVFQTVLLDRLGDYSTSADYLETFLKYQGSRKLPGTYTGDQKEVFYGVKVDNDNDLTAIGYNMDHGAVLWGLAHHYLYSKDKQWLEKAAPKMIKAADWIIEQRNQTKQTDGNGNRALHYGLLPSGMLEDCFEWRYWYATNAYAYMGLQTMAEAFKDANLPQAGYYLKEASDYRKDIRNSLQKAIELAPVVRLRNNTYVPYVPVHPYQRFRYFGTKKSEYYDRYGLGIYPNLRLSSTREVLYGPVTLIKTGIIDQEEPMANWILDDWEDNLTMSTSMNLNTHGWVDDDYWFSRGGMVFQANLQNPVSIYLDRHDNKAALRSLYNNFVSLFYPDVIALSEEYRMWEHASGPFYKTPDESRFVSQVLDLLIAEKENEVWLGNGVPERWLEPGLQVELYDINTRFGKYRYTLRHGEEPETIVADISLPGNCPKTLLFVNAPFHKPIQSVSINGKKWTEWNASRKVITLPRDQKSVRLLVEY